MASITGKKDLFSKCRFNLLNLQLGSFLEKMAENWPKIGQFWAIFGQFSSYRFRYIKSAFRLPHRNMVELYCFRCQI